MSIRHCLHSRENLSYAHNLHPLLSQGNNAHASPGGNNSIFPGAYNES